MDETSRLVLFSEVVEAGSFSAAARGRRTTRAAVAKQIARLEDELGSRLLHRSTRRMSTTDLGRQIYERAVRIRTETREIAALAEDAHGDVTGTLRITSVIHFGRQYVQPVVREFLDTHAGARVDLRLDDRVEDLIAAGLDIAIRVGDPADSALIARRIADVDVVICASPAYLERRGAPAHPRDLVNHDCVVYASNEVVVDRWTYLDGDTQRSIRVDSRYRVNHGEMLMDAVVEGVGIALLPCFLAVDALRSGAVVSLLTDYPLPNYAPMHAIYPARQHLPRKTRVFLDALVAHVGDPPIWTIT